MSLSIVSVCARVYFQVVLPCLALPILGHSYRRRSIAITGRGTVSVRCGSARLGKRPRERRDCQKAGQAEQGADQVRCLNVSIH